MAINNLMTFWSLEGNSWVKVAELIFSRPY